MSVYRIDAGGYGGYRKGECVEAVGFKHVLCNFWSNYDNSGA